LISSGSFHENYRHQADALRQYQMLKSKGVPDRLRCLVADRIKLTRRV
jgi:glycosylphosphatidylinositol transamidase (GPIT) subunit GPI8